MAKKRSNAERDRLAKKDRMWNANCFLAIHGDYDSIIPLWLYNFLINFQSKIIKLK